MRRLYQLFRRMDRECDHPDVEYQSTAHRNGRKIEIGTCESCGNKVTQVWEPADAGVTAIPSRAGASFVAHLIRDGWSKFPRTAEES